MKSLELLIKSILLNILVIADKNIIYLSILYWDIDLLLFEAKYFRKYAFYVFYKAGKYIN